MVMNSKGNVRDIALMAVILFAIGLLSFIMMFVYNSATDLMLQEPLMNESTASGIAMKDHQTNILLLDYIILAIFIAFLLSTIILSYLVGGEPIFTVMYLIFFVVVAVLAGILTSVWDDISDMVIFGTTVNNLPITDFLLGNLTLFVIVTGFIGLITMYVRGQRVVE